MPENNEVGMIKTPGGEFYLDASQFEVDYSANLVTLKAGGGGDAAVQQHNNDPNAHQAIGLDCGDLG